MKGFMMAHLTTDSAARKEAPMATGVLDYFPLALAAVARLSKIGNDKHNPGQPLHWSREKSNDHADCIMRHLADRGVVDSDGELHDAKVAWRALAMLQLAEEKRLAPLAHVAPFVAEEDTPYDVYVRGLVDAPRCHVRDDNLPIRMEGVIRT